jgi:hypothetical protein
MAFSRFGAGSRCPFGLPFIQRFPTLATPLGSVNSFFSFFGNQNLKKKGALLGSVLVGRSSVGRSFHPALSQSSNFPWQCQLFFQFFWAQFLGLSIK